MHDTIRRFDRSASALVARIPERFRGVLHLATVVGYPAVMAGLAALIALIALYHDVRSVAAAMLLSGLSMAVPTGIKMITRRTRPDTLYVQNMRFKSYSFPSGHSYSTLVVLGLVGYLLATGLMLGWLFASLLYLFIILVGLSRIYLGAHFPSDVIGGWVLGIVALIIIIAVTHV